MLQHNAIGAILGYRARVTMMRYLPPLVVLAAVACSDTEEFGKSSNTNATGSGGATGSAGGLTGSTTSGPITASMSSSSSSASSSTGSNAATSGQQTAAVTTGTTNTGSTSSGAGGASTQGTEGGTDGLETVSSSSGGGSGGASTSSTGAGSTGSSADPVFHIFMLMGQSNMAGVATRQPSDNNTDERLKVLGGCNQPAGQWNIANPPLSDCPGEKGWNLSDSVDPGIWFGKTLLEKLPEGDTIGLIGTAESGESINTFISGGVHHQMILNKIALAKQAENGRFAGIIFHQGESDSGQSSWPGKVVQLYNEVKAAWGVDYDVPFILGELPQGGCCAGHNTLVHQAAEQLPMGYWVSQEGTNVMDQYHFDHASVVLMGQRYGETMIEALGW